MGGGRRESAAGRTPERQLRGSCRCGAVQYSVADAFLYAAMCHCSGCRAATGSAFKPFAGIEREKLAIMAGHDQIALFGDEDANDTRCAACGCFLYSVVRDGRYVHVAMGSLVDDPQIRPTHHIFVGSKAAWDQITDALPSTRATRPDAALPRACRASGCTWLDP
jgi:hypothetical protein